MKKPTICIVWVTFLICIFDYHLGFAETVEVQIIKSSFIPHVIKIKKGDSIRWINRDGLLHTVASGKAPIHDGLFKGDYVLKEYETLINQTGLIDYFCELHNATMRGVILIEDIDKSHPSKSKNNLR